VAGLVAAPWEIEGRHGISFRAKVIEAAKSAAPATASGGGS
jgi:hypothetical protein